MDRDTIERIAAGLRAMSRAPEALIATDGALDKAAVCGVPILYCEGLSHGAQLGCTNPPEVLPVWAVPSKSDREDVARFCNAAGELGDTLYDVAMQSVTRSRRGGDSRL